MKNAKVSLLALSVLAGGALVASAAATVEGENYELNAAFTNPAPKLADIQALPASSVFTPGNFGVVATDGGGKIAGVMDVTASLGGGTTGFFVANVSGSVTSVGGKSATNGAAKVTMSLKGSGYADNGSAAKMSLTFKGTPGIVPESQAINTALPGYDIFLNSNGSTNHIDRYDPWADTSGLQQGYTTYSFQVDRYAVDTLYSTNGFDTNATVVVTNGVDQSISAVNLAGEMVLTNAVDDQNGEYGDQVINFGTPILSASDYVTQYGTNAAGYIFLPGTNILAWAIAEQVSTIRQVTTQNVTNAPTSLLKTNDDSPFFVNEELSDGSIVIAVSNTPPVSIATNETYLLVTPLSTNLLGTNLIGSFTNVTVNTWFYPSSSPLLVDNEGVYGVNFTDSVYTNDPTINPNETIPWTFDHQEYRFDQAVILSSVATNFSLTAGDTTTYFTVFTNLLVTYAVSTFTTSIDQTNTQTPIVTPGETVSFDLTKTNLYLLAGTRQVIWSNYYVTSYLPGVPISTNFVLATNIIYGASIADLGTAFAAYNSEYNSLSSNYYNGTFTDYFVPVSTAFRAFREDIDEDIFEVYLWGNQFETNYVNQIIGATTTNTVAADFGTQTIATRSALNTWNEIDGQIIGSISAGTTKVSLSSKSPASGTYQESHDFWTAITSDPGEQSYTIMSFPENLNVFNLDNVDAKVVRAGTKFYTAGDAESGTGSFDKNGGYKATLKGVASSKGSTLSLAGSTGALITGYDIDTNAPVAPGMGIVTIVNLAAPPNDPFVLSVTNTISGILQVPAYNLTLTNADGTGFITYSYAAFDVVQPNFLTNSVSDAIKTITLNGKVKGQTLVKNVPGFNLDAVYPELTTRQYNEPYPPIVEPPALNHFGWPLSYDTTYGPPYPPFPPGSDD